MPLDLEGAWGGGGGGGGRPRYAALQPEIVPAHGMWALLYDGTIITGADRSGNARHLTDPMSTICPDLIPGQKCGYYFTGSGWATNGAGTTAAISTALKMPEFTITARICPPKSLANGPNTIASAAGAGVNVDWAWVFNTGGMYSFWHRDAFVGITFSSNLQIHDGSWHFVSYRRAISGANYVVTIGRDKTYATSGALAPSNNTGASPDFNVGRERGSINPMQGMLADVCFWPLLSNAQIDALNDVAMGL